MSQPTPTQSRILWVALTVLAITLAVACAGTLVWSLGQVLRLLAPVLWPLAVAAVLAYLLDPVVDWLEQRKIKRPRAIIMVFAVALLIVLGIAAAVVPRLIIEAGELAERVPDYTRQLHRRGEVAVDQFRERFPGIYNSLYSATVSSSRSPTNSPSPTIQPQPVVPATTQTSESTLEEQIAETIFTWLRAARPTVTKWFREQLSRVPAWFGLLASVALVPVYCFYFLLEKSGIQKQWTDYLPVKESRTKEELIFVLTAINDRLIVFFRGQVLVAACDGVLYGLGFLAIGLNYSLLLGLMGGLFSIIPYIGATVTVIIAAVLSIVQFQDWLHPLLVLGVFGAVQAAEGLVISPKIIGDRVGLHPLTIIVSVMIGTTLLGGLLGGLLAIPLTAALRVLMFRYVWKKTD